MEESKNEKNTVEVSIVSEETIQNKIYNVRGYNVMILCFRYQMKNWKNF